MVSVTVLALTLEGCGGPNHYVNPNVDMSEIRTVAVLPLDNVGGDRGSAEKVQRILITELLATGAFDVIEPGTVNRAIQTERIDLSLIGNEEYKRLGKTLKVQGFFVGTIVDYEEGRGTSTTGGRVTIQLRLIDAASGKTFWSISRTAGGDTFSARLFGMGAKTGVALAEQVLREELQALVR